MNYLLILMYLPPDITYNLDKIAIPWNFHGLSQNPNVTMKVIMNNPYKPWYLSENPNITWEIVSDEKIKL